MSNILRTMKRMFAPASTARTRAVRIQEELYEALKMSRPRGLELPLDADPDLPAAVERLLKAHPELTVVRGAKSLSLFFRDDIDPTMNRETREFLTAQGNLVPGGTNIKGGTFHG